MGNYLGIIIELTYALNSKSLRPIHEGELSRKFTDEEHQLFASGSDVVLIENNPERALRGYWEKRRDVAKEQSVNGNTPVRMVTYAQADQGGIPRITRTSLAEMASLVTEGNNGWSEQTREVMRRY